MTKDVFEKVLEFLRERCVKELCLRNLDSNIKKMLERLFSTLATTKCKINHVHSKLTKLEISYMQETDADLSSMIDFFTKGYASQLEGLILKSNGISLRQIKNLCKAFNDGHCKELTQLTVSDNPIGSEQMPWDSLFKGLCKLTKLDISKCNLDIDSLFESQITRNQLTDLNTSMNKLPFGYNSLCLFKDCLKNEQCKLTKLKLDNCSLTAAFIPSLCDVLQNERCQLTDLSLSGNAIGDKAARMLFEDGLFKKQRKVTRTSLNRRLLLNEQTLRRIERLQNERCQKGAQSHLKGCQTKERCNLTKLSLARCSLTNDCIKTLCKTLKDERCTLTELRLRHNDFSKDSENLLREAMNNEMCKARGLTIIF